ncbi:MAG: cyclic nucleotide-binding domain-containing protein [Desulfobulbus sp.]|jgi:extracellular factor (EF) 3-hydroxypalmitic acid methyl ester biosynthesis protein
MTTQLSMPVVAPEIEDITRLQQVLAFADVRSFGAGEPILSPNTKTDAFYYLINGLVEVSYTDSSDTRITVGLIGSGEFFGEIGFFDQEDRVRDIQTINDAEVAIFHRTDMERMQEAQPELFTRFILLLTRKICGKFRRIVGDNEPMVGYAQSLSTKHSSRYTESKPLPAVLIRSSQWHQVNRRMEAFKSELFNLSHRLQKIEAAGLREVELEERCHTVLDELNTALPEFKQAMTGTGYEEVMWGYVFKEIFPYFMRSRFAERAYFKPKGYAGDFLMMEHIYADTPQGEGKIGEIIDEFCLGRPGSQAIRGRRILLKEQLLQRSAPRAARGEPTRIMNLACGPNRELFDFLSECEYSETIEALCVDIDSEALQYTNQHVNIFPHRASIRLMTENVIKWSLGRTKQRIPLQDIIYSSGLCDYLDTRLFRALITQCHNHLNPGGTLMLGNFTFYPDSLFLDKLLKWELIYRTEEDLRELFAPTPFGDRIEVVCEPSGVNLYAIATKD